MIKLKLGIRNKVNRVRDNLARTIREQCTHHKYYNIYNKYSEYTMIHRDLYVGNLVIAEALAGASGCVIECGTWRGGMIAGIADLLGPDRRYFLFDSYEGLPPAEEIDGEAAFRFQANTEAEGYLDNCSAPIEFAERAMALSVAKNCQIIKGWFNETLPRFEPPEKIALLRLDADWFGSTTTCLECLVPHLAPDGVILIDDYYAWEGCSKAVHQYLAKTQSVARIVQMHGVAVLRPNRT
jgi:hypothetical protein